MFAALRANDLIWPYVVNGYLKGKAPPAFDLLYWNADDTNLPGPMFCWYLRNTYLENQLREPGDTVQCGVPVDLSRIDVPAFLYASREDHIVPWHTAYASTRLLGGDNPLRARRKRPHRRRDQSAGQEQAQLLDRRRCGADAAGLARRGAERRRKLVAGVERMAARRTPGALVAAPRSPATPSSPSSSPRPAAMSRTSAA